ncbi:sensor domain-containing diguanylate cyclase [Comamonas faecalis]|uniref:diguanylate cyclase n=1 Tax=Comamonas faecalis TaxID=1387849 RepID=A0ABP7QFD5_9BURK
MQYGASIRIIEVNQRTLTLFAAPDQATLIASLNRVLRDDMHNHAQQEMLQLWEGVGGYASRSVNYTLDGRRLDVQISARILPGHEDSWSRVLVSLQDITALESAQRQLQTSERYARDIFAHSPVSLWVEDFSAVKPLLDDIRAQGIVDFKTFLKVHPEFVGRCAREIRVIDVNQATLALFGASDKAQLLAGVDQIFRAEMLDTFAEQLIDLWEGRLNQQREVINYNLAGEPLHIHMQFSVMQACLDDWAMVLVSLVDISARKKAEAYLEYLGKHDVLTGLRNRAYYMEELSRLARKGPWPVGVVVIDLNGLKATNDERGHGAGDAMLRRCAEVLAKAADSTSCVARIGGDEFCMLLPATDEQGAWIMVERITALQEMNNQFYPGQALSVSMGMAVAREGDALEAVVHRADQSMYAQKTRYYAALGHERRSER